jgi:hypothetical protein
VGKRGRTAVLASETDDNDLPEVGDNSQEHTGLSLRVQRDHHSKKLVSAGTLKTRRGKEERAHLLVALHTETLNDLDGYISRSDSFTNGSPLVFVVAGQLFGVGGRGHG